MFTTASNKKIKILIPVLATLLGAFGIQKGMTHKKYNGTNPGYYKQWFEEKKNDNGVIPKGLRGKWAAFDRVSAMRRGSETPFDTLWELGPRSYGGRTRAVWIDPNNDNIILAASISGGMWRSEDGGFSWNPLNEQEISMMPSCITHNPMNPSIIYYGTGESRANSADVTGNGVFKSIDGGKSFTQLASTADNVNFTNVWDIAHSQDDPNTLFVATHNRGVFRSEDAGSTWERVYTSSPVDRIICLPNNRVIIGRTYNGVLYSEENGDVNSFKASILNEAVGSSFGRVQLSYCKNFPNVVYAMMEGRGFSDPCAGFYRSSDSGKTFIKKEVPTSIASGYNLYCQMLGAHPSDTNKVVSGGVRIAQSNNGGLTWSSKNTGHSDHHAFYPFKNSDAYLIGTDGGMYRYTWSSKTAAPRNTGYKVTQFYAGAFAPDGFGGIAGTQDNGTHYQYGNLTGRKINGGDGAFCHVGLQDGTVAYLSTQNTGIRRISTFNSNSGTGSSVSIADPDFTADGVDFINCYAMSPTDQEILFYRTNRGWYRSLDAGDSWERLNTANRGGTKAISIGYGANPPVYFGGTGGQLYMMDECYTASSDEYKSLKISGKTPTEIYTHTIKGITIDPNDDYTIFLAYNNFSDKDRIWKVSKLDTDNPVWTSVSGDLPDELPVNYMDVDPDEPGKNLFAGTDFGLYYSIDSGNSWFKEDRIPGVAVHQVKMRKDRKLFIFTHGRGMWYSSLKTMIPNSVKKQMPIDFTIYPNPAGRSVSFNVPFNGEVKIFNTSGKMVHQSKITANAQKISLPNLMAGVYFVNFTGRNQTGTRRLYIR